MTAGPPLLRPAALRVVGGLAVVSSVLYFVSDVLEVAHGGFTPAQLVLTFVAEATIPLFVLGLLVVQLPVIGPMGVVGATSYAYAFTYFSGTVLVALVLGTKDWATLATRLEPWVTVHGVVMMVAGTLFGLAVVRAHVLPRWTGVCLVIGVLAVGAASPLSASVQLVAAAIRDLAFAGMGAFLMLGHGSRSGHPADHAIREVEGALPHGTSSNH